MKVGDVWRRGHGLVKITTLTKTHVWYKGTDIINAKEHKRLRRTFQRDFEPVDMATVKRKRLIVRDLQHCEVHSDAGRHGMSFVCPTCEREVVWAPYAWWSMRCSCRHWSVEVKAVGTPLVDVPTALRV